MKRLFVRLLVAFAAFSFLPLSLGTMQWGSRRSASGTTGVIDGEARMACVTVPGVGGSGVGGSGVDEAGLIARITTSGPTLTVTGSVGFTSDEIDSLDEEGKYTA